MSAADRYEARFAWLARRERALWVVVLLGYGVGDLLTTLVGLSTGRGAEAGPVAAELGDEFGIPALVVLKLASLGAFYLLWRLPGWPARVAVPMGVAGTGPFVTAWNVVVRLTRRSLARAVPTIQPPLSSSRAGSWRSYQSTRWSSRWTARSGSLTLWWSS